MAAVSKQNLEKIKLLAMDVDGVLTDGSIVVHSDGSESKVFNLLDGHGIRMWHRAGFRTAFISGRTAAATEFRAKQLEVEYVFQDCREKLLTFNLLLEKSGLKEEEIAYIGDDLMDIPIIRRAGLGIAVANAVDEVKKYAHYVTIRSGGGGAVREAIEYILKSSDRWDELMKRYVV